MAGTELKLKVEDYLAGRAYLLMKIEPLVGVLLTKVNIVEDSSVGSMGVSADTLYFNRDFVKSLSKEECLFVLYHELLHLAFLHPLENTRKGKNPTLFNIACDLYINKFIVSTHFSAGVTGILCEGGSLSKYSTTVNNIGLTIPTISKSQSLADGIEVVMGGGVGCLDLEDEVNQTDERVPNLLLENWVDVDHMDVCQVYDILNKDYKMSSKLMCDIENRVNSLPTANLSDLDGLTTEQILDKLGLYGDTKGDLIESSGTDAVETLKGKISSSMADASNMVGLGIGTTGSGMMLRKIGELLKPTVDWRRVINKRLFEISRVEDLSYKQVDTRYSYLDIVFPTSSIEEDGKKLNNVTVAIDVSGSISTEDYTEFISETVHLFKRYKADGELLHWDTDITSVGKVTGSSAKDCILSSKVSGYGGTSSDCIFEYYDKIGNIPSLIIIFTDGYISSNPLKHWSSKYKNTIWVINKGGNREFETRIGSVHFMS